MDARTYAKVVGVVIVLIGVGGLILGEQSLLGVLNIDIAEDIVHLVTGGLMAAVGFRGSDRAVRSVVGGLGIVYLLVGVLGIFVPDMFGLLPSAGQPHTSDPGRARHRVRILPRPSQRQPPSALAARHVRPFGSHASQHFSLCLSEHLRDR